MRPTGNLWYEGKKYFYELMTDSRHGWFDKFVQGFLLVLSLGYGVLVHLTCAMYKKGLLSVYEAPKPLISVGNITTGGVGKTPLVIWLAKFLNQKGIKAVVLSRGYGSSHGLNDETKMFKEILPQVPIVVGKNRKESIQKALSQGPVEVFVADDAFQHWSLKRDLDIVVIDSACPLGNGRLLPRGILRERPCALARADVFMLTKSDRVQSTQRVRERLRQINSKALIVESRHAPGRLRDVFTGNVEDLNFLKKKKVISFCAIGDPSFFEHMLEALGVILVKDLTFVDHHPYSETDLRMVVDFAKIENINILVTTHKDAVKIIPSRGIFQGLTVFSLDIDLKITQNQDEFVKRILSLPHH